MAASVPKIQDYRSAVDYLLGRINYERVTTMPYRSSELKLARMRRLLQLLGNPQEQLQIIHVAGTKGKGSTCHMLASILMASGCRTGLFSSPHLELVEERFRIDLEVCPQATFVELVDQMVEAVTTIDEECEPSGDNGPTFFEITTAIAYCYFAKAKVDFAIIEVGLGGRLDSTNVCTPLVSIVTSISFDHTKQLGNTLHEIATEKAGIIKPRVPVVTGVTEQEPLAAIQQVASQNGSRLFRLGKDFDFQLTKEQQQQSDSLSVKASFRISADDSEYTYPHLSVGLPGPHQAANAAVAVAALHALPNELFTPTEKAIRQGLQKAVCPARVEVVRQRPLTILDVAHNVASVAALVASLPARRSGQRRVLILAATQGKDHQEMCRLLVPQFDHIVLTRYTGNPRGLPISRLARFVRVAVREANPEAPPEVTTCNMPVDAWETARQVTSGDDLICVTGSFFIAGEISAILKSGS